MTRYQSVIDLKSGLVFRLEALAWLYDGLRLLTPNEFLPLLDEHELFLLYRQGLQQLLADAQPLGARLPCWPTLAPTSICMQRGRRK